MSNQNETEELNSIDTSEKQAEKIGKDIGRGLKNTAKDIGRKLGKFFLNMFRRNKKKLFILLTIIIVVFILLPACLFKIDKDLFDQTSRELTKITHPEERDERGSSYKEGKGEAKRLVTIENRSLILNSSEYLLNLDNYIKKNRITNEDFAVSEDYREVVAFLEAEVVTLFPDVRYREDILEDKPLQEGELQGCVKFMRKHEDGTEQLMEYTPFDKYAEHLQALGYNIYTDKFEPIPGATEDSIRAMYNKVRDEFTLDENFNLVISVFSSEKVEVFPSQWYIEENGINSDGTQPSYTYKVDVNRIDYQTPIVKNRYYFPFELGIGMLMTTVNPGFCMELTELVKDSEIVIDIQDNLKKQYTTREFNYTANYKIEVTYGMSYKEGSPYEWSTTGTYSHENKPYVTIVKTTNQITTKVLFQEVDVWLFYYLYTYEPKKVDRHVTNEYYSPETPYDDPDYAGGAELDKNPHKIPLPAFTGYDATKENASDYVIKSVNSLHIYEKKTGQQWHVTEEEESLEYEEKSRYGRFAAEKFLTLLRVDPNNINEETGKPEYNLTNHLANSEIIKYPNKDNTLESPAGGLTYSNLELLVYTFLINNEKTEGYAEIINNLMAIYTGYKEYDPKMFVEYDPGDFKKVPKPGEGGDGGYHWGNTIQEKIWLALKKLGYSDEVVAGAMGNIHHESGGFQPGITEKGGTGIGLIQWSFGRADQLRAYAQFRGVPWQDEDLQIDFLIAELTGTGPAAGHATRRTAGYIKEEGITSTYSDWANSTTIDDATLHFMRFFESPQKKSSLGTRQKWAKYYYDLYGNGKLEEPDIDERVQAMIEKAIELCNDPEVYYSLGSNGLGDTYPTFVCDGFCRYLYRTYIGIDPGYVGVMGTAQAKYCKGTISVSQMRPGDLIVFDDYSHVMLYIGNGKIAHASGQWKDKKKGIKKPKEDQVLVSNYWKSTGLVFRFVE